MRKESFTTGIIFTVLSATGVAFVGLLGKLGGNQLSLEALIFWRYLAAFFFCLFILGVFGKLHNVSSFRNPKIHFLRAFFVLTAQYSFYYYIERNSLLNGLVLLSLGPLLTPLIEWALTRHPIGKSTWVGLLVSFMGILCILQPDGGIFSPLSLIGVLSGISQGCSQVVFGMSGKSERSEISTLYMFFICFLLSFFPYLFGAHFAEPVPDIFYACALMFSVGAASVVSQLARAIAYKHGTPSRLATFFYFSILSGGFLDWLVFHKVPNTLSLIGALLVIMGGALKIYLRSVILKNKS